MKRNKTTDTIGWIASLMGSAMFLSFFHQAYLNLQGVKGSLLIPFFTIFNCLFWVIYGLRTHQKCIIFVNVIGLVGGVVVIVTGII